MKDERSQFVTPDAPRQLSNDRLPPDLGGLVGKGKTSTFVDPDYGAPVNGLTQAGLEFALNQSIDSVLQNFPPKTGICILAFDFGQGGGLGYISNAKREDMIRAMKDWIQRNEK